MLLARTRWGASLSQGTLIPFLRRLSSTTSQATAPTGRKPTVPSNVKFVDESVLDPELSFNYQKGASLPLSSFIVDVLEGPFTTPKASGELSPVGKLYLSEEIFRTDVRPDIMARVVRWQRNRWQQGTHKAKTKAEVSGTGKKPYKQKGTGLARQGSLRNPHFRKGGAAFGPSPRDHDHELNKKERRLGLRSALCARLQEGRFHVIDNLVPRSESEVTPAKKVEKEEEVAKAAEEGDKVDLEEEDDSAVFDSKGELVVRTRQIATHISRLGVESAVLVDAEQRANVMRACKNIPTVHYLGQVGLNVFTILKHREIIITVDALRDLEERLSETEQRSKRYMKKGWTPEDAARKAEKDSAASPNDSAKDADTSSVHPSFQGRIAQRRALYLASQHRKSMDPSLLLREIKEEE